MRFGILFFALAAHAQTPSDVRQLAFMAGCWENQQAGTLEYWTKPGGGSLLGVSRTVKGGKTVFTEYMQIREQEGGLVMSVQLKLADKVTPFRLTKLANDEAVFENPEH